MIIFMILRDLLAILGIFTIIALVKMIIVRKREKLSIVSKPVSKVRSKKK